MSSQSARLGPVLDADDAGPASDPSISSAALIDDGQLSGIHPSNDGHDPVHSPSPTNNLINTRRRSSDLAPFSFADDQHSDDDDENSHTQQSPTAPKRKMALLRMLAVFECPACQDHQLVQNPVTLECGHSVCSKHFTMTTTTTTTTSTSTTTTSDAGSASIPTPQARQARYPMCPVRRCASMPSTRTTSIPAATASARPAQVLSNSVRVSYAPGPLPGQFAPTIAPTDLPLDSRLTELISLVARACKDEEEQNERRRIAPLDDSTDSSDAEPSQDKKRSTHKRRKPDDLFTNPSAAESTSKLERELVEQLTCPICFLLLFDPVTTSCQHTFCARCLQRTLDHSRNCPICRREFPNVVDFYAHPTSKMISSIVSITFPEELEERSSVLRTEEHDPTLDTPIFICDLAFPGLPHILHIFEPRYRLMLRRCLQMENPEFGMIVQPQGNRGLNLFGTMLRIQSVKILNDGRSVIETIGTSRFRLINHGERDGYMIARIERFEDVPTEIEKEIERVATAKVVPRSSSPRTSSHSLPSQGQTGPRSSPQHPGASSSQCRQVRSSDRPSPPASSSSSRPPAPATNDLPPLPEEEEPIVIHTSSSGFAYPSEQSTASLVSICREFVTRLRDGSTPLVVQRLDSMGPIPQDVGLFTFWVAAILPIDVYEKVKLLPIRSARLRLRLVVQWIEHFNNQWWFNGCVIA